MPEQPAAKPASGSQTLSRGLTALSLLADHGLRIGHEPDTRVVTDASRYQLGARAVEEVMRVAPTVTWVTREAREDVELHGLRIPAGGIVQVLSHAIGTDERSAT